MPVFGPALSAQYSPVQDQGFALSAQCKPQLLGSSSARHTIAYVGRERGITYGSLYGTGGVAALGREVGGGAGCDGLGGTLGGTLGALACVLPA